MIMRKKRILLYIREEYVGLFSAVIKIMFEKYDFVCFTPTIKAYAALKKNIGNDIKVFCLESDWCKYKHIPNDDEITTAEMNINEPIYLTMFSEIYSQKLLGNIYYRKERDMNIYNKLEYYLYNYINSILIDERPDIVFFECMNAPFSIICNNLANKYHIPCFSLVGHYLPNTFYFAAGRSHRNPLFEYYYNNQNELTAEDQAKGHLFANSFNVEKNIGPYYLKAGAWRAKNTILAKYINKKNMLSGLIILLFKSMQYYMTKTEDILMRFIPNPLAEIYDKYCLKPLSKRYLFSIIKEPLMGEKYYVYFVHLQPEATTSAQAPFYADQKMLIEKIAIALPHEYKLYIKEHPADIGKRGKNFYDDFKYYPNIKIIDPYLNAKDLVAKSTGVITITGTIGFEAAFLNKPVIMFGNAFYDCLPHVTKINNFNDLPRVFRRIKRNNTIMNDYELNRIAASYVKSFYKGRVGADGLALTLAAEENVKDVANSIDKYIDLLERPQIRNYINQYNNALYNQY